MAAPEGNTNRATQYRIKRTLEKLIDEASTKYEGMTRLEAACRAQIEKAEAGDSRAFSEIADRLDGKAMQSISGPDGGPIPMQTIVNFVTPGAGTG